MVLIGNIMPTESARVEQKTIENRNTKKVAILKSRIVKYLFLCFIYTLLLFTFTFTITVTAPLSSQAVAYIETLVHPLRPFTLNHQPSLTHHHNVSTDTQQLSPPY